MLLLTGATGNVGRELSRELDAQGVAFRVLVRDLNRAATLPPRAERFVGDLSDPATLRPAFEGVTRLFLLVPGVGLDHTRNALAAATSAGVQHIVLLSSFNVLGDPIPAMGRWHHEREQLIQASGIPATLLRPSGYMTNALEWLSTIRAHGYVLDPIGPGRYAPIDPADIAAVAALALTTPGHENASYVLTGEETFTVAEQVAVLAMALNRPIEVREVATPAEAIRSRYPDGAPPALEAALLEALTQARADTTGFRTNTVNHLLGRAPTTFANWCARNAPTFQQQLATR